MAEQGVSNERKKELEQLDPFQQNLIKALASIKEYKKQVGLIAGAVVLIIIVFSGIMYSFGKAENKASYLMSQALTKYVKVNDPIKGFVEVKEDFALIFTDYANTAAGKLARVEYAKICYDASKFDQSYQYYKEALELFSGQALMENFILVSLGHVSLARNDVESAKKYFNRVENAKIDLLKDEARFALAMLDETGGNVADSKKMYEKIVSDHAGSIYYPVAKSKIDKL
ncbi:MAG: tetratricopeptide repeat protein [Desulfobacula sp.]|nr:tetratricopeptide repeat protein [Desulfobacula sp.]